MTDNHWPPATDTTKTRREWHWDVASILLGIIGATALVAMLLAPLRTLGG